MEGNKLKVIYIAGAGRSGSTLLEKIIGQHRKIFAIGESRNMWKRSFMENQLCSCGKSFYKCEVWKRIRDGFLRKGGGVNPKTMVKAFNKCARIRHYIMGKIFDDYYCGYISKIYFHLYSSVIETMSVEFVLDSSKHPVLAHILSLNNSIELYVIHIVRDPRGVAYSWRRKKIRPEIVDRIEFMPRYSILRSALSWRLTNKIAMDLCYNTRYLLVKYEDLILFPKRTVQKIFKFLGVSDISHRLFIDEKRVILNRGHTVSGNPIRFQEGEILLELDEEWKERLDEFSKRIITILTFPYIRKYGYV